MLAPTTALEALPCEPQVSVPRGIVRDNTVAVLMAQTSELPLLVQPIGSHATSEATARSRAWCHASHERDCKVVVVEKAE